MTSTQARTIDRLADEVVRAEARGDTVSAEFLQRCLISAIGNAK